MAKYNILLQMDALKKHQIILIFLLFAAAFFTYFPAMTAGFASLDDAALLAGTNKTYNLTASNIFAVFKTDYIGLYHPLVTLSFAVERYFFGMVPAFFHFDNMLLHILNTILVFLIFARLTKSFAVTYIISFLFAVHPVHVEVVAWISARKDTLYSAFYLLSFLFYIKTYDGKNKKLLTAGSALFFLFACLSKAMGVTLPFVLILTDYFTGNFSKKNFKKYTAYFLITAIFIAVGIWSHYRNETDSPFAFFTLMQNILNSHFHVLFYIYKFLIPVKLYCMYPLFYDPAATPPWYIFVSPLIVYSMILFAFLSLKKTKKLFFGFLFFIIVLMPSSGILPIGIAAVADRYAYLAYIGLFYIFAEAVVLLYGYSNAVLKKVLMFLAIVAAGFLIYLSFNRSLDWQKETFAPPGGQPQYLKKSSAAVSQSPEPTKFDKINKLTQNTQQK